MHLPPLILVLVVTAANATAPGSPAAPGTASRSATPPAGRSAKPVAIHAPAGVAGAERAAPPARPDPAHAPPENLLAGPARCVLRYLEAVRHAGPLPDPATGRLPEPREPDYAPVRALTAPRTLEEIAQRAARGEGHPLAPWRDAARSRVLHSFQLEAVRRAPHGAAVVTVAERFWSPPGAVLEREVSEYLVARVDGAWRVIDRSPGQPFEDASLEHGYAGFFDDPATSR